MNSVTGFEESDFDVFKEADEASCDSCLSCLNKESPVKQAQCFSYRRQLEATFPPKFDYLQLSILAFLRNEFDIILAYKFEPPPSSFKMRPFCYGLFAREYSGGQIVAQLNFRLSYDRRPGESLRTRKYGVKFSMHDKCSKDLRNEDLENFKENVLNPHFTPRVIAYLRRLSINYFVYRNRGFPQGIDPFWRRVASDVSDPVNDLLSLREDGTIEFQEIFRAFYWEKNRHRLIIQDINKLAMETIRCFLDLYPFYLFATVKGENELISALDRFDYLMGKNSDKLSFERIELIRKPPDYHVRKGDGAEKFVEIFFPYVHDASSLLIVEPYMEEWSHIESLIKLLRLIDDPKRCDVLLVTRYKKQESRLEQLRGQLEKLGFRFRYNFEWEHDRTIETEWWRIILGIGLHMFPKGRAKYDHLIHYHPIRDYKLLGRQ